MKRTRLILFISLGIGLLGLIIPLVLMLSDLENNTLQLNSFEDWLPFIIIPVVLVIVVVSFGPLFRMLFPPNIKNGITAEAQVVEIRDTGVTINDNPQVALMLEVRPKLAAVFMTEIKTVISRLTAGQIGPGSKAEVLYDPNDTRRVVLKSIEPVFAPAGGPETRLEALSHLREKGLITAEEYERKRQEILKNL